MRKKKEKKLIEEPRKSRGRERNRRNKEGERKKAVKLHKRLIIRERKKEGSENKKSRHGTQPTGPHSCEHYLPFIAC